MSEGIKISVLMSAYRESEIWLREAVESILHQSFTDFEFIIVQDDPTNTELLVVLREYERIDKRIILLINEKNLGLVESLNRGLATAKGDLIARMDADDISEPERLEKQYRFMCENTQIDLMGTNIIFIDENGMETGRNGNIETDPDQIRAALLYKSVITHPTFLARREVLVSKAINGYRPVTYAEDYDLFCRLVTNNHILCNSAEYLLKYRVRATSITRAFELSQLKTKFYVTRMFKARLKGLDDHFSAENLQKVLPTDREQKSYNLSKKLGRKASDFKNSHQPVSYFFTKLASQFVNRTILMNSITNTVYRLNKTRVGMISGKWNTP